MAWKDPPSILCGLLFTNFISHVCSVSRPTTHHVRSARSASNSLVTIFAWTNTFKPCVLVGPLYIRVKLAPFKSTFAHHFPRSVLFSSRPWRPCLAGLLHLKRGWDMRKRGFATWKMVDFGAMRVGIGVGAARSYDMKEYYMGFEFTWRIWELREKWKQSRIHMVVLGGGALFHEDLWVARNLRKSGFEPHEDTLACDIGSWCLKSWVWAKLSPFCLNESNLLITCKKD